MKVRSRLFGTGAQHAERGVLGVDQAARDADDAREHAVEGEVGRDRDDRVEEQLEPGLLVEGSVHALDDSVDQLLELDLVDTRALLVHLDPLLDSVHLLARAR